MANTNSAVSDSLFSPVSLKDKGQDGQRHFLKLRVCQGKLLELEYYLSLSLFFIWWILVKYGRSWLFVVAELLMKVFRFFCDRLNKHTSHF